MAYPYCLLVLDALTKRYAGTNTTPIHIQLLTFIPTLFSSSLSNIKKITLSDMVQIITTTVGNPISSANHEIKIGMVANVHAYLLLTILLGIGGTYLAP